jgi:hypothetical protein
MRRGIAGKCEVARVTVGSLGRLWGWNGGKLGIQRNRNGDLVRSYCCGEPR